MSEDDYQKMKNELAENLKKKKIVYLDEYRLKKKQYGSKKV